MKKVLFIISIGLAIGASSCKKEGTVNLPEPDTTKSITAVPTTFSQKILIEEFVRTDSGNCPTADYFLNQYISQVNSQYVDKIYGTTIHVDDIMQVPELLVPFTFQNVLDTMFNLSLRYPIAMANRNDPDPINISWANSITDAQGLLGDVPNCGLAIDASQMNGNVLSLSVHAGFRIDIAGEYRLHVFLVQTSVQSSDSLYDQVNTTTDTLCPYYFSPNPIHNYIHQNVLRKVISAVPNGEVIPAVNMHKGKQYIKTYSVDLSNFSWSNCSIIAFVDKYADYAGGHRIMNVQKVAVGSLKNWD